MGHFDQNAITSPVLIHIHIKRNYTGKSSQNRSTIKKYSEIIKNKLLFQSKKCSDKRPQAAATAVAAAASISSSTDLVEMKNEVGEEEGKLLEHLCTNKCCYAG